MRSRPSFRPFFESPPAGDLALVEGLRAGDDAAFAALMDLYSPALLRVARMYVPSQAVAEEVVQETWLGVLNGIGRFEGRSSLKTWLFRILTNIAKTRGERERRAVPFSSMAEEAREAEAEPSVDPDRFQGAGDRWPRHWALGPTPWELPEDALLSGEARDVILRAIEMLPPGQREVITLRDVEGWPTGEICNALDITETNQRVLLHRARSRVRAAIEEYLGAMEPTA
jgi:RNA polymerase sigma-70 factor, ECF subfamily